MNYDTLAKRFDYMMSVLGFGNDYEKLAKVLDISSEEVLRISLKNSITKSTAKKIENLYEINSEWLMYNSGNIYIRKTVVENFETSDSDTNQEINITINNHYHYNQCEIINTYVSGNNQNNININNI